MKHLPDGQRRDSTEMGVVEMPDPNRKTGPDLSQLTLSRNKKEKGKLSS
jgi:hypothetical protein